MGAAGIDCCINWCMSSRREASVRILALLQRKTSLEITNRTLKCLKRHYSTVHWMKNVAVLTEVGAFALFFRPHPGGFDSSRVPTLGNLPSKAKKMLMMLMPGAGGSGPLSCCLSRCKFLNFLPPKLPTFCLCSFAITLVIDGKPFPCHKTSKNVKDTSKITKLRITSWIRPLALLSSLFS